tara:strand:+ start:1485 stop:2087 length:603 start_codon:yes stop_codon:yes gene_type:complete
MKTEKIDIKKVKPNPDNPRVIKNDKYNKLVTSIKEFPEMLKLRPIVVNKDMIVLGGNMRLKACKEAKLKEVYIIKADELTEEQQKEFMIKDNASFGEWDWDIIANEWNSVDLEAWGIDVWQNVDDMIDKVNTSDEWVGMPEFEVKEDDPKLIIRFRSQADREEFAKTKNIEIQTRSEKTWNTWYPYKEKEDLKSLKYENQ